MNPKDIYSEFSKKFQLRQAQNTRGIGIEAELPIVNQQGKAVPMQVIQQMFEYLHSHGFEINLDPFSGYITSASKANYQSAQHFDYYFDKITTEAGYSTIEVVLAPQASLQEVNRHFLKVLQPLYDYLASQNCRILGFGTHPVTPPSKNLIMPQERYLFFQHFSQNNVIPNNQGADTHLLTITASNQCHIGICQEDSIMGVNVLNALSGLHIALNANSSVWQGKADEHCQANREFFWEDCYPQRLNQLGIPPQFETMTGYLDYLLQFEPMLIQREQGLLKVLNKSTLYDFMFGSSPIVAQTIEGNIIHTRPQATDLHYFNTFCYFDARLVPQYGTIESRVSCQQPPQETLAPTALTLGILENLDAATQLMHLFAPATWQQLRQDAGKHTLEAHIQGQSIVPLLEQYLDIAVQGLKQRNLGEEVFLQPLYQRLQQQQAPATVGAHIFEQQGVEAFLDHYSFQNPADAANQTVDKPLVTHV